jgi:hypothetical protein
MRPQIWKKWPYNLRMFTRMRSFLAGNKVRMDHYFCVPLRPCSHLRESNPGFIESTVSCTALSSETAGPGREDHLC